MSKASRSAKRKFKVTTNQTGDNNAHENIRKEHIVPCTLVHENIPCLPEKALREGTGMRNKSDTQIHQNFTLECVEKTDENERQVLPAQSQRNVENSRIVSLK